MWRTSALSGSFGIRVYQGDYPASNPGGVVVAENTIRNVGGTGIFVDSSADSSPGAFSDITIAKNSVTSATFSSLKLFCRNELIAHVTIHGNTVQDGADTGMDIDGGTVGIRGVTVSGNVITSHTNVAIDVIDDVDECVYDGNVARGNGTNAISGTGTNSVVGDNIGL